MKMDIFSGPCVLESEELANEVCHFLVESLAPYKDKIELHFKGSLKAILICREHENPRLRQQ